MQRVRLFLAISVVTAVLATSTSAFAAAPVTFTQLPHSDIRTGDVALGDIDGDGTDDIAYADEESGVRLAYTGSGSFVPGSALPGISLTSPDVVALGDWDGNGLRDVFATNGSYANYWYTSAGPTISSPELGHIYPGSQLFVTARVGTFDSNDCDDIALLSQDGHLVFILNGPGGARNIVGMEIPFFAYDVQAADLNEDGIDDVVVTGQSGCSGVYFSHGDGGIHAAPGTGLPSFEQAAIADFDGDGHIDIAVGTPFDEAKCEINADVYRGRGDGTFSYWTRLWGGQMSTAFSGMGAADLNADGCTDLLLYASNNRVWVYRGRGVEGFRPEPDVSLTGAGLDQVPAFGVGSDGKVFVGERLYGHFLVPSVPTPDSDAPSTTLASAGATAADGSTWLGRVALSAQDAGWGVRATLFSVDGAAECTYTAPVSLTAGAHSVAFRSVDEAGNQEPPTTVQVLVDPTAPATSSDAKSSYAGFTTIRLKPSDSVSGVARTVYRLDSGAETSGTAISVKTAGKHTLRFRSIDRAGNEEGWRSATFTVASATVRTPTMAKTARRGVKVSVSGYLLPRHTAGSYPIRLYRWKQRSNGSWAPYGYVKAKVSNYSSYSKYAASTSFSSSGRWRIRAYHVADSGHAAAWSSGYAYTSVK